MTKDEQSIKNEWMQLTGTPIITDNEIYAYITWLEKKHVDTINHLENLITKIDDYCAESDGDSGITEEAFQNISKIIREPNQQQIS